MKQTFLVNITHQHNATWQGTAKWINKETEADFCSALELIRFLDASLESAQVTANECTDKDDTSVTKE